MTDAHNHLHQLLEPTARLQEARQAGVTQMMVNGTSEKDWPTVAALAQHHPEVVPAFGLHPWQVPHRTANWLTLLRELLEAHPLATIGECGLDRWQKPFDLEDQIHCLQAQIDLANELQRSLTIHCLQAWGPLLNLLQKQEKLPPFLLHAYSGSREMVSQFAELGAYFSFNGYFLHERKQAVRETFLTVPPERLLLETDAPAMLPPKPTFPLPDGQNHPAHLVDFLNPLAELLGEKRDQLKQRLEENFVAFLSK